MLRYLAVLMLLASVAIAGDVKLDITATTNQTANVKMLFKDAEGDYPDTSTVSWETGATVHSGDFDTGIAAAVANADSGGINLSWTAATGHEQYRLDFNPNDEGWATVAFIHADSTTYGHDVGGSQAPRRGEIEYRIRSFTEDSGDTTWSAVVMATDVFYNQAKRVYSKFHASNGTTIIESTEGSALYVSYPVPDETPPGAPTGLAATPGDGSVALDWNDNGESDLDDYTVYRGTVSGTRPLLQAGVAASNYTDNTAVNGTEYFYSVTATDNSANESGHSSEVSATPAASGGGTYAVASGGVYIKENTDASNVKIVIYDDAGDYLAESPSTAIGADGEYMAVSWPSGPTLVSGDAYYLCVIADGTVQIGTINGDLVRYSSDGTYASPPSTHPTSYKNSGHVAAYVQNSSSDLLLGFTGTTVANTTTVIDDGDIIGNDDLDMPEHTVPTL